MSFGRKKFLSSALYSLALAFVSTSVFASSVNSRDFVHPQAAEVRLESLDVLISVFGPPRVAQERFAVKAPAVVRDETRIWDVQGQQHLETLQALVEGLEKRFTSDGFRLRLFAHESVATKIQGSSVVSSLSSTVTVQKFRAQSAADAILVVRAVPIDSFFIDRGSGSKIIETPQGRERVQDYRPEQQTGRLLLAQAFLFDAETGVRLWSRHAPNYPKTNRLPAGHPFLQNGYVGKLTGPALAKAAVRGLLVNIFDSFPKKRVEESVQTRNVLRQTDRSLERTKQQLADKHPWALSLDVGWTSRRFALPLKLFEDSLPALDNATLTPNGLLQLTPQLNIFTTSGWVWHVALPLVYAPGLDFSRTYFLDEPGANIGENARDRLADVTASGLQGLGLELSAGPTFVVRPDIILSPVAGVFSDVLSFEITPAELLTDENIVRFGAVLGGELTYLPNNRPDSWFISANLRLRAGIDLLGAWFVDPSLGLGFGILL